MAEKTPLVFVSGIISQLPPGDSIGSTPLGNVVAGEGLTGGGDLSTGDKRVDVSLSSTPSGLLFVGDSLGLDGAAQVLANQALASGVAGSSLAAQSLVSGIAAQTNANTALVSGNAALTTVNNFSPSNTVQFTAASPVVKGSPVGLDDSGKVQTVRTNYSTRSSLTFPVSPAYLYDNQAVTYLSSIYHPLENKVIISFIGLSGYAYSVIGTFSDYNISFDVAYSVDSNTGYNGLASVYCSVPNRIFYAAPVPLNTNTIGFKVAYLSSGVFSTISSFLDSFGSTGQQYVSLAYSPASDRVVIFSSAAPGPLNVTVAQVVGLTATWGSEVAATVNNVTDLSSTFDSTNNKVVCAYRDVTNSGYGTAIVGNISGFSVTFGTPVVFNSASTTAISTTFSSFTSKIIIGFSSAGTSTRSVVGTVSGTSISFGSSSVINSSSSSVLNSIYDSLNDRVVFTYNNSATNLITSTIGSISGTSVISGGSTVITATGVSYISSAYNPSNSLINLAYRPVGASGLSSTTSVTNFAYAPTVGSRNNFIGIAQGVASSGSSVNVLLPRGLDFNQSNLSPGNFYYLNPSTSGFTSASGQPISWSGSYNWAPTAKAVSTSGLLLLDTV